MTYCNTLAEPLKKRIEVEKQSLDTIAQELCGDTVKNPRQKVIRLIKILLDEDILIKNAETLGYDAKKAVRTKSASTDSGKIVSKPEVSASPETSAKIGCSNQNAEPKSTENLDLLVKRLRFLLSKYNFSIIEMKQAMAVIEKGI
jgi:hypothetical protein